MKEKGGTGPLFFFDHARRRACFLVPCVFFCRSPLHLVHPFFFRPLFPPPPTLESPLLLFFPLCTFPCASLPSSHRRTQKNPTCVWEHKKGMLGTAGRSVKFVAFFQKNDPPQLSFFAIRLSLSLSLWCQCGCTSVENNEKVAGKMKTRPFCVTRPHAPRLLHPRRRHPHLHHPHTQPCPTASCGTGRPGRAPPE